MGKKGFPYPVSGFPQSDVANKASEQPVMDPMTSEAMRRDAELHDLSFVSPQEGWAVGDRGVIWHTSDGGRRWELQESGVACPLYSVCFVNARLGWAAGGIAHPFLHTSTGVVLMTEDGGQRWQPNTKLLLPLVKQVRFFSERLGWAVACPSALFSSGVFFTNSGGMSWEPMAGGGRQWLGAGFLDPRAGVVAGRSGMITTVRSGMLQPSILPAAGARSLTRVKLVPPQYGWLIGDGGLVLMTGDLGQTWQSTPGPIPPDVARGFDFSALSVRGPKCWIAGSPGTRVFFSPDAGQSWTSFPTGQTLPIHALSMVDDQQGWAVGALGTILNTTDGGQTWQRQRMGGLRAALLVFLSQPKDVPLEMLARLSGNEGYLSVVEALTRHDTDVPPNDDVPVEDRFHEAVAAVGGCATRVAWQFPTRQMGLGFSPEQILATWDAGQAGQGVRQLQEYLVKEIRMWRPDVVVTDSGDAPDSSPVSRILAQAIVGALQAAGDGRAYADQQAAWGLAPWQVKRTFAMLPRGTRGSCEVSTSQLATRLGRSLAEQAATPRGLLDDVAKSPPPFLGFRLLTSESQHDPERADFFSGIAGTPGSEARRALQDPAHGSLETLTRSTHSRRNVQAIIERTAQDPESSPRLLAKTDQLLQGLDADGAAWVLYYLGQHYYQSGDWESAAEAFTILAQRYSEHPFARPALRWLLQYFASSDAAWRIVGQQRYVVQQPSNVAARSVRARCQPERAVQIGGLLEQTQPATFADPALQFSLAAALRSQGQPRLADRYYQAALRRPERDAWWACGEAERGLAEGRGTGPKPSVHCVVAAGRPRLDGRLDDAVWQQTPDVAMASPFQDDAQWPAEVRLAHDREFLYLAIRCRQASSVSYETSTKPRSRDADLSANDRVEVFLDVDRDRTTYFRLVIDHRGWTNDSCWGNTTWDPTWFVAAAKDEGYWSAEIAIPLDQLTAQAPTAGEAWAIGLQRIVPGVGFQSWNTPAAVREIPEGFGYLIFD